MKKYLLASVILFAGLAAGTYWWWLGRRVTLAGLQKKILIAQSPADTARVLDALEQYYLQLEVPDSIRARVEHETAKLLQDENRDAPPPFLDLNTLRDPYQLEGRLISLLQDAAIALVNQKEQAYQDNFSLARRLAAKIDTATHRNYWGRFVQEFRAFTPSRAMTWLRAKQAERLCNLYQDSVDKFADAEKFAALGLSDLRLAPDERIRLDLMQRLQYILSERRSLFELSVAMAQRYWLRATALGYHSRANGFVYLQAETLVRRGHTPEALARYQVVIETAQKYPSIPAMEWFTITGLLGLSKVYLELGTLEKAREACERVAGYSLSSRNRIRLHRLQSDIYKAEGNYDKAEQELHEGMALAEATADTFNLIICRNDLGVFFEQLRLNDRALDFYQQAESLFKPFFPNVDTRVLVLRNIAILAARKNDSALLEEISRKTGQMAGSATSPYEKAQLRHMIGSLQQNTGQYREASRNLQIADSIFTAHGLLLFALGARMDYANCLTAQSKLKEAKALVESIDQYATASRDPERAIEAKGSLAKIQHLENEAESAIVTSNRLIEEIEDLSARFSTTDRLMAYRQKTYDYLKDAVLYEISYQRPESAFVKLDYAKAYALKSRLIHRKTAGHKFSAQQKFLNLDATRAACAERSLVLDFMVTQDSLYAFMLDRQHGLRLLSKRMQMETLGKMVRAYQDSIARTIAILRRSQPRQVETHHRSTMELGHALYEALLGWPALQAALQQTDLLYIIPDEFLYEVPFATLIQSGRESKEFLVNHVASVTLPSASFLQEQKASRSTENMQDKRVLLSVDRRFPGADELVKTVQKLFPRAESLTVIAGTSTKEEILAKLRQGYEVYIFVGHGAANTIYPEYSYIELPSATPRSSKEALRLSLSDLNTINWMGAEMVILVGCETADGRLYRGTGISGLHLGFLLLGAQNVVGNLWEVDANHALAQARDFVTAWARTHNPAQALQTSQRLAVRALEQDAYYAEPHPFLWGSSILLTSKKQ